MSAGAICASVAPAVALRSSVSRRPQRRSRRHIVAATTMGQQPSTASTYPGEGQPKLKLCYFELYAKGLQCAMVAAHSGLEWSGKDADFDWKAAKHDIAPFKQMPLLFIEGQETPIAQSTAIAVTIGRMSNTDGSAENMRDFSTSAMLMAEAEDLYAAMQKGCPTLFVPLGQGVKTKENHEELWAKVLPHHIGCLENLLGDSDKFTTTGARSDLMFTSFSPPLTPIPE